MQDNRFDVLIVGAGISGIGAAYHLQTSCPDQRYAILESRERIGGTWDLFKYPGIRSDSDMQTMGFSFKPWVADKAIADGPSILQYVNETADEHGIIEKVQFGREVIAASWSSDETEWTVRARSAGQVAAYRCKFLFMCSGYYNYAQGYTPEFPGIGDFSGKVIHPQLWDEHYDHAGKKVVVIGSGATAVTLVPELAKKAEHVTMLQRSPTYVVSAPDKDRVSNKLRDLFGSKLAYGFARWKNILFSMFFYAFCQKFPRQATDLILNGVRNALGPRYDVDKHFKPRYKPWDQRMCLVPNGDLFNALRNADAQVVTDEIEKITERGIQLRSGQTLDADLIVTATGLDVSILSNIDFDVDGVPVVLGDCVTYKSMMLSGVPNLAFSMGYTNASWTLKSDLTGRYVVRLLKHMQRHGFEQVTPRLRDQSVQTEPMLNLSSGYVLRAAGKLPKQGSKAPWKLRQNYLLDILKLCYLPLEDDALEFVVGRSNRGISRAPAQALTGKA